MRRRNPTLPALPEGSPYIRVAVPARGEIVLRVPSLHRAAQLGKAANARSFAALIASVSAGAGLLGAVKVAQESGSDLLELMAALIGVAWVDPTQELETPALTEFTPAAVLAYGDLVYEELDAAGWRFEWIVVCALALLQEITERSELSEAVVERARGFATRTAPSVAPSAKSSPSSSADGSAPSTS